MPRGSPMVYQFSTLNLGGPTPVFKLGTDFQSGLKSYTLCERP